MYSAREAGKILSVHRATIKAWIREGRLPAVLVGGSWRLTEETIQEIIKNGFDIQPKTVGRPRGGSIAGKPTLEADAEPSDEEINRMMRFSDEYRRNVQRAERAKKEGGEDAQR